ncbi:Ig-like domain-containing protein [Paenimyroides viscosum]|uniref:T9SS C-terminal target domain-containing protein n=1 Tax=Paenimyroides viscosum TaxID=2488729 RepID=A0A3P1B2U5_9FLAO|nr:T9SS type A sorting domain-containing protein [Paenimyroides viscosum]RRA95419.1 T9SS C-terminal target domain-containing protein [Paenimyroides viscosum]
MRQFILIFLFLIPFVNWGQPYSMTWDGSTSVAPWTQVTNVFSVASERPCQGTHSLRTRLNGTSQNLGTVVLRSPSLFTATGGVITFSYDYKWLIYNTSLSQAPIASSGNQLDLKWEWANTATGPWNSFSTVDGTNHVLSAGCNTVTATFAPKPGALFVRITVKNTTPTADNYFYLDNITIDQGPPPTCIIPDEIYITNKKADSFTINWTSAIGQTTPNYDWEVRTSGAPGSGPVGLVNTTPPATTVSGNPTNNLQQAITGLAPSTNYKVYVRSNCSSTDSSFWSGIDVTTACLPPTFTPPAPKQVCGIQDSFLAVSGPGTSFWYDINDNLVLADNNVYNIPQVSESHSYTVFKGLYDNFFGIVQAGTGLTSGNNATPFTNAKSQKIQYIYLAEELKALGFSAGVIKSFGFKVGTTGGTLQRDNFTIHMGETPLEEFSTDNKFIPVNRLTLVKNLANQLLVVNDVNMFKLDTPFHWNGTSNIVVQVTYANPTAATIPTATSNIYSTYSAISSNRTLFTKSDALDMTSINAVATGTRSLLRTNGYFDVIAGCFNDPITVELIFTEAPEFVLSADLVNNCQGSPLTKLYVLTGAGDFNTYTWTITDPTHPGFNDNTHPDHPDNAIVGDQNIGWTFNTTGPMEYTLVASSTLGLKCLVTKHISVENNPAPQMSQILSSYSLCTTDIQELKIDNFVNETPVRNLFNGNITGVTLSNGVIGDAIANETTLFSEGTGSLKVTYAAQTNAIVDVATSVNMVNLKSILVEFDHIAAFQATSTAVMDYAYLEYTTDNGATWKPFLPANYIGTASTALTKPVGSPTLQAMFFTRTSYADWSGIQQSSVPSTTPWKSEKFVVPAADFTGTGTFKVRFRMGADGNTQFPGWYIDNLKITPISNNQVTWTPIANLYYDQNATVPYDGSINSGIVYLKGSTNSMNVPYKVEVTNQYGCKAEKNFTVSIGLNEAPTVTNLDSCGAINVSATNFGKNPNGTLNYYASQTSSAPITQITTSGIYYVEQVIFGCKSARVPFTVVINAIAPVPTATASQSFCGSATVNDLVYNLVSGFQIKWYTTATLGTPLAANLPINNGTYYGELTNGVCVSPSRVAVNVTVGVLPAAISLSNVYICGISTIADIAVSSAPGATVNWYQNITDVTPLSNTTVLLTGTYFISQKINNCESSRTAVNVSTVQNLTMPTAANIQTFCGSAIIGSLTASPTTTGANVYWYGFSASDTPLANTTPLTSGTYYVGQSVGDCDSPKRAVSVRILSVNPPVINPINICGDATVSSLPLNPTAGTNYKIYASPFATTDMGQNDPITTGTYYVSLVDNGCETGRATVYITVSARPNAPTGNITQTIVDSGVVQDLKANEPNVVWFDSYNDAVNNSNPLPFNTPLQNDRVYYGVLIGPTGCTSLPIAVTVKIVLGLNELDLASLRYYPNPVDSELTISYKEAIKAIQIYDVLGKMIKAQKFEANEVRVDVSNLSAGTYMVKVQTDTGSQFVKIVKK